MSEKQDDIAVALINEVCLVLEKHLGNQDEETRRVAHMGLASYVLGCELACSEQNELEFVINSVVENAQGVADGLIEGTLS